MSYYRLKDFDFGIRFISDIEKIEAFKLFFVRLLYFSFYTNLIIGFVFCNISTCSFLFISSSLTPVFLMMAVVIYNHKHGVFKSIRDEDD